jgi:hypothetical protein
MTNAEIVRFIEPLFAAKYRIPGKDDRPNKIPYEFDCQTFVKYVMKHCFDRDIFMIATPSSEISVRWPPFPPVSRLSAA